MEAFTALTGVLRSHSETGFTITPSGVSAVDTLEASTVAACALAVWADSEEYTGKDVSAASTYKPDER